MFKFIFGLILGLSLMSFANNKILENSKADFASDCATEGEFANVQLEAEDEILAGDGAHKSFKYAEELTTDCPSQDPEIQTI